MNRPIALAVLATLLFSWGSALAASPGPATGDTLEARRTTQALNILESQGYAAGLGEKSANAFADFHAQGKGFVATITQNGRNYVVTVDPDTGEVMRRE